MPDPEKVYPEFENWGKLLGTNRIANQDKEYWDLSKAKEFLAPLKIRSVKHYPQLCADRLIPEQIPKNPWAYYKKKGIWAGYSDFGGKIAI